MDSAYGELEATIKALTDISRKKRKALSQILTICENQHTLLAAAPSEEQAEFMAGLSAEKQSLIDQVIELDDVFGTMYKKAASRMEEAAGEHFGRVKELQEEIKLVTRLDAKIRAAEEETRVFSASLGNHAASGRKRGAPVTVTMDMIAAKYREHGKKGAGS